MIKDMKAYRDKLFEADYKEADYGKETLDKVKSVLKYFWLFGFQWGIKTGFSEAKELIREQTGEKP